MMSRASRVSGRSREMRRKRSEALRFSRSVTTFSLYRALAVVDLLEQCPPCGRRADVPVGVDANVAVQCADFRCRRRGAELIAVRRVRHGDDLQLLSGEPSGAEPSERGIAARRLRKPRGSDLRLPEITSATDG